MTGTPARTTPRPVPVPVPDLGPVRVPDREPGPGPVPGTTSRPVLGPGRAQIWWARRQDAHPGLHRLLDAGERARLAALRFPAARDLYLTAHALARAVIADRLEVAPADVPLPAVCKHCGGAHGKPEPPEPLRLSLSHSGGRVVVVLSHAIPVGVDVEEIAPHAPHVAERVLTPQEHAALEALPPKARDAGFIRYWARKEALLKATGDGLAVSPDLLSVTAPDAPPRLLGWAGAARPALPLCLYDLDAGPGYRAALATVGAPVRLSSHDGSALLRLHITERQPTG